MDGKLDPSFSKLSYSPREYIMLPALVVDIDRSKVHNQNENLTIKAYAYSFILPRYFWKKFSFQYSLPELVT